MEQREILDALSRKLDVVIGLLLRMRPEGATEKADILALKDAGFTVEEIARVLGKTPNSIYLVLSRVRRKKKAG